MKVGWAGVEERATEVGEAGRGWAVGPTRLGLLEKGHLRELVYRAPCLAQKLVD